jgi:mRNA interferase MazF
MRRGDFVTVAIQGDFGKPGPALVVQANQFDGLATLTVLPVTSTIVNAPLLRITVEPNERNRLARPSQVMIDKAITVRRDKVGPAFGTADDELMLAVNRALLVLLGIA